MSSEIETECVSPCEQKTTLGMRRGKYMKPTRRWAMALVLDMAVRDQVLGFEE